MSIFLLFAILSCFGGIYGDNQLISEKLKQALLREKNVSPDLELSETYRWPNRLDPEVDMTIQELIESKGYKFEEHNVTTEDGYILQIHRIPGKQNSNQLPDKDRPVVILQHGLLCDSAFWVLNLPEQNLPFILADQGADVWLGNNRGNRYARRHKTLSPESSEFWDFTFDEMASHDLPATLFYIKNATLSSNLYYGGHSEGNMIGFAGFPQMSSELRSSVKKLYAFAPLTNLTYLKSPVRVLARYEDQLFDILGDKDILTDPRKLTPILCSFESIDSLCESIIMVIMGWTPENLNETRTPVYLSHTPSGTSVKNLRHFLQLFTNKRFRAFDYGNASANMEHYNQPTPPDYDMSYNTYNEPKVVAYTGGNDWLATPRDTLDLMSSLNQMGPNGERSLDRLLNVDKFSHIDLVWGITANEKIFKHMVEDIFNAK